MKKILKLLVAATLLFGMNATQVFAQEETTLGLQSIDQKIANIEVQIDGLKSKGLKNLSNEERIEYGSLKKELIKTQREKTAEQKKIIADEKKKQKAYKSINEKLDSIEKSLSVAEATN